MCCGDSQGKYAGLSPVAYPQINYRTASVARVLQYLTLFKSTLQNAMSTTLPAGAAATLTSTAREHMVAFTALGPQELPAGPGTSRIAALVTVQDHPVALSHL